MYSLGYFLASVKKHKGSLLFSGLFLFLILLAFAYAEISKQRILLKTSKIYFKTFFFEEDVSDNKEKIITVLKRIADGGVYPYDGIASLKLASMSAYELGFDEASLSKCADIISGFWDAKKKIGDFEPWLRDIATMMLLGASIDCNSPDIASVEKEIAIKGFLFRDIANELLTFYYYKNGKIDKALTHHNLISINLRENHSNIGPYMASSFPTRWQIMDDVLKKQTKQNVSKAVEKKKDELRKNNQSRQEVAAINSDEASGLTLHDEG